MDQQLEASTNAGSAGASGKQAPNINIDINGDEDGAVKNLNVEPTSGSEGRVGLSKDELMKYAYQPFWVRCRNILFASFWIVWVSILVAAIGYVVHSPGCVKVASAAKIVPAAADAILNSTNSATT